MAVGALIVLVLTMSGLGPTTEFGARISMAALIAFCVAYWIVLETGGVVTTEARLRGATDGWSAPFLIRQYPDSRQGHANAQAEATILAAHGYAIGGQSGIGGHMNVGRTLTGAVLTGGLFLLLGGSRTPGVVDITYVQA